MPAKSTPNGFFMFMQAERNRMKEHTKTAPSMQDMAVLCAEAWKSLSATEKARYDETAKEEKCRLRNTSNRDNYRLDNQGQVIAERRNVAEEDHKRRNLEAQTLRKSWEGKDILDMRFHLVNFQVMYDEGPSDSYLPMEVGFVSFTLREGITNHMHDFIDPGDAPEGNRHLALKYSEDTHKIPLCFEKGEDNFLSLWKQIEKFVGGDSDMVEMPPIFCLRDHRACVESCLDFIHYLSCVREPSKFTRVYTLEDLVTSLILHSGKTDQKPSERQVRDSLLQNQWDYVSSIRCPYHNELDCSYCSLSIVRRMSFCLFDLLSNLLNFELTSQHMPDETAISSFRVIHPTPHIKDSDNGDGRAQRIRQASQSRFNTTAIRYSAPSPISASESTSSHSVPSGAWGGARVNRVEVKISDSDSDNDSPSEIRSTSDQYNLKELRKPRNPAMVSTDPVFNITTAFGRGVALHNNIAFPGRGGRGIPAYISSVRPPPGFGPMRSGSLMCSDDFPSLVHRNPTPLRTATPAVHGPVWGIGRSRGMPPQI